MIDYEMFCKIKQYQQNGLNAGQIADQLALDDRTVKKWLEQDRFRQRKKVVRKSKLDPYKDEITRLLNNHPYSARQIYQKLKDQGFSGGYTIVKDHVRKVRPLRKPAFLKLAFAPGECAQVDWGSYGSVKVGNTMRRLSFFVMVLCYSRLMYVEFTLSQTMEHWLACHQNAFRYFGFLVEKIMVDNLKSAVLKRIIGQAPVFNPKYLDFSNHYGFTIVPCGVGKGNEKGRVESGVGYTKKNFLKGLDIPNFESLHAAARIWLDQIANVRIHGETKKRPIDLFNEEKSLLKPLPENDFDIGTVSEVRASRQFRIALDANRYSVPAEYAGARLTLKTYPDRLLIYDSEKLIARHQRSYDRHGDFEDPDHPKPLIQQRKKARDSKIMMRFLKLSRQSQSYYQALEEKRLNTLVHVRKIVALAEIYGDQAVGRAMEDALYYQAFSSEYIANILEQRKKLAPEKGALNLTRNQDLLDLEIPNPDLAIYDKKEKK